MISNRKKASARADQLLRVPPTKATSKRAVHRAAKAYKKAGFSLIPIRADGTKMPAFKLLPRVWNESDQRFTRPWSGYRQRQPTLAELRKWFCDSSLEYGIAILAGAISGNLEILDLDNWDIVVPWMSLVERRAPGLLDKLVLVRTPRPGLHVYYRCRTIGKNEKLARMPDPETKGKTPKTVIETKGEGGYCLAPPSPAGCHSTGRKYTIVSAHDLTQTPTITPKQRAILLACARELNRWELANPASRVDARPKSNQGGRPGDDFNARANWSQILEPHGWVRRGRGTACTETWRRPGKDRGASATTNYEGSGLLYVFSSNAAPFEECTAYTKFHAYAILEHDGDFHAAARELGRRGYGSRLFAERRKRRNVVSRYAGYERLPQNRVR